MNKGMVHFIQKLFKSMSYDIESIRKSQNIIVNAYITEFEK